MNYRIVYEDLDGIHSSELMDYVSARKLYDNKLTEKNLFTIWCNLEFYNFNDCDKKMIVSRFTRKTRYEYDRIIILNNIE